MASLVEVNVPVSEAFHQWPLQRVYKQRSGQLEAFLLHSVESGLVANGVLAQDINQASSFWHIREGLPEALMKAGAVYKYDLSLPLEKMYDLVEEMRVQIGPAAKVVAYGHLGDGNLHLNISAPAYDDNILAKIEPFVYEWTSKNRGSISAEHGLGLMKAAKIHYSKSPETVQVMASIKKLLDPNEVDLESFCRLGRRKMQIDRPEKSQIQKTIPGEDIVLTKPLDTLMVPRKETCRLLWTSEKLCNELGVG